ncbi:MAG: hypothetical protein RI943_1449 [Bacteroidota bacterium]
MINCFGNQHILMKNSSYLYVIIFLFALSSCTTKYYEGNHIDVKDDLITYDGEIINKGTVVGLYERKLWRTRFGVPRDGFLTPLNIELDVDNGQIVAVRVFGKKETEKVRIETVNKEKYWRYTTLEGEFKDGYFYHYFPEGGIEEKFEGYFKGGTFYINGKYFKYEKDGKVIEEETYKDKYLMGIK